jgi:exodeoxyribonuclease-3
MKLITWNVNGIRARQSQLQELLEQEQPDVLCLQEIKATPDQIPQLLVAPTDYWCYWHGGGGYSGVAMLVKCSVASAQPVFTHPPFDHEHRIVVGDFGSLRIASVYVPNGGKDYDAKLRFLSSLVSWAVETNTAGPSLVLCGDLNVAREERDVHPRERKPNQIGTRPEERAFMETLREAGLVDVGRALDPDNNNLFTWWAPWRNLQRDIGWRIDYVFAGAALAAAAVSSQSMREFGSSDHAPLKVVFEANL